MAEAELECPDAAEDLYLAASPGEVEPSRPVLTGDIFEEMGMVESAILRATNRVACLSPYGINLLQQRFVWYLTRFLAPTHRLGEASEAVFEEVDLCSEWVAAATGAGDDPKAAETMFHEWIRSSDESGTRRQDMLREPQRRAGVRREMRRRMDPGRLGGDGP